ncbi:Hypothetical protein FKW44_009684 [Caligus rogercresseyi]|uniref:Uncharacterized protein n=1 Tax=Caligus rogercresseyi TaxID=217165 RepID=A0A7T8HFL7_CALRO|nr:Hypothetical protein FKW44_009684 [Caligus rogercresseyi]
MHVPTLPPIPGVPDPEGRGTVKQSPYSPDLNLCDRFLFRKLKHLLRRTSLGATRRLHSPFSGEEEGQ